MKNAFKKVTIILLAVLVTNMMFSCNGGSRKSEAPSGTTAPEITMMVFAAASLTDVLSELIDSFKVGHQVRINTNMASSGTLARQIEQGGTPDLFISASKKWADYVDSIGFVVKPYKEVIAHNDLVLIAPNDSKLETVKVDSSMNIMPVLGSNRLSMGDPAHVPAGQYARQALEYFGLYQKLTGKLLPAKDVRSALMVVELGESPLGIVYRTDAQKSAKVKIVGVFPDRSHKPIVYVSTICKESELSKEFYDYLKSDKAKPVWAKYGFNN